MSFVIVRTGDCGCATQKSGGVLTYLIGCDEARALNQRGNQLLNDLVEDLSVRSMDAGEIHARDVACDEAIDAFRAHFEINEIGFVREKAS
jgi:hypothetical protein